MTKNNSIEVKCDDEEYKKIINKAKLVGLPASTYLRMLGLKSEVKITEKSG